MIHDYPNQLRPLGKRVLVRRYTYPEKVGSLYLPEREDLTRTLWEAAQNCSRQEVVEVVGVALEVGDIIRTDYETGVAIGEGFWLIHADDISNVIKWQQTEEQ